MQRENTVVFKLYGSIKADIERNGERGTFYQLSRQMESLLIGRADIRNGLRPILLVSSSGGSIETAFQLYSFLTQLPQELTTMAIGLVESAAVFPYLAGKQRFATPNSMFFIHQGTTSFTCPPSELPSLVKATRIKSDFQVKMIASVTRDERLARQWVRNGVSFSAEEAKYYGIVTKIVEKSIFVDREVLKIADFEERT
jgi:ATP-dependent Clp protease, protease subunit